MLWTSLPIHLGDVQLFNGILLTKVHDGAMGVRNRYALVGVVQDDQCGHAQLARLGDEVSEMPLTQ